MSNPMNEPLYVSKYWSVTEWDCLGRSRNEYAWDNEDGRLCTNDEKTANLFRLMDELRKWRIEAGLKNNWVVNTTEAGYKSGYRTPEVNYKVGGEVDSYHMRGCAADICISGQDDTDISLANTVMAAAKSYGTIGLPDKLGIGYYGDWIHIDTRGYTSRW